MVPWNYRRNALTTRSVSGESATLLSIQRREPRVDDENEVQMTGSMILSLIWTHLVSLLLFALTGTLA